MLAGGAPSPALPRFAGPQPKTKSREDAKTEAKRGERTGDSVRSTDTHGQQQLYRWEQPWAALPLRYKPPTAAPLGLAASRSTPAAPAGSRQSSRFQFSGRYRGKFAGKILLVWLRVGMSRESSATLFHPR